MARPSPRRRFIQAVAAVPAASALAAQQPPGQPAPGVPANPTQPVEPPRSANAELPRIEVSVADAGANPMPHFFDATQMAALRKLCSILMPRIDTRPGALEAGAPEFLDFLIGHSATDRQQLYREGLDALNAEANRRFQKPFADAGDSQAASILKPLNDPWTYDAPNDPLARFLQTARLDVRTATVNSREYIATGAATNRRMFGGVGQYWYSLD